MPVVSYSLYRNTVHVQGKHLVSVGGYIYLWDWRSGHLITKLQATSSSSVVSSVSFSSDAKFIITAGKKHLKFWTLETSRKTQQNGGMCRTVKTASLAIREKISNLSIQKECLFTSVASSAWTSSSDDNRKQVFPIYTLTDSGLVQFRASLKLTLFELIFCVANFFVYRHFIHYSFWAVNQKVRELEGISNILMTTFRR